MGGVRHYADPSVEVVKFDDKDVVRTSGYGTIVEDGNGNVSITFPINTGDIPSGDGNDAR